MSGRQAQLSSRTLTDARPRVVAAICRAIAERGITGSKFNTLVPTMRRNRLYELRVENKTGTPEFSFGTDRLIGLAEALDLEVHFVEKDEIADLRNSFEKSIDRMEGKMDTAIGTMSDVRDEVIKITAQGGKSNVPSVRRPAAKTST